MGELPPEKTRAACGSAPAGAAAAARRCAAPSASRALGSGGVAGTPRAPCRAESAVLCMLPSAAVAVMRLATAWW